MGHTGDKAKQPCETCARGSRGRSRSVQPLSYPWHFKNKLMCVCVSFIRGSTGGSTCVICGSTKQGKQNLLATWTVFRAEPSLPRCKFSLWRRHPDMLTVRALSFHSAPHDFTMSHRRQDVPLSGTAVMWCFPSMHKAYLNPQHYRINS